MKASTWKDRVTKTLFSREKLRIEQRISNRARNFRSSEEIQIEKKSRVRAKKLSSSKKLQIEQKNCEQKKRQERQKNGNHSKRQERRQGKNNLLRKNGEEVVRRGKEQKTEAVGGRVRGWPRRGKKKREGIFGGTAEGENKLLQAEEPRLRSAKELRAAEGWWWWLPRSVTKTKFVGGVVERGRK